MATNHKPVIRGTDEGIWRRIRLVPFTVVIPEEEQDTTVPEKLRAELPGILAWAVRGCLAWQQEGLPVPEEVQQATAGYREEMDTFGRFLAAGVTGSPSRFCVCAWPKTAVATALKTRRASRLRTRGGTRSGIGIED